MNQSGYAASTQLPPGLIFEIARRAGIEVREDGDKRPIRCPFHKDKHASAFLSIHNVFYCSVCTPDRGWSLKTFSEALRAGGVNVVGPAVGTTSYRPASTPSGE
jgi:hypothetical protein